MKAVEMILAVAEYSCIAGFLYTSYSADRAMNKAGIGNLDLFAFWSRCSWLVITAFLLLWMVATVTAIGKRQQNPFSSSQPYWKSILPDVILPLVILFVSWLAYLVLS
jgi:hypothetical protein